MLTRDVASRRAPEVAMVRPTICALGAAALLAATSAAAEPAVELTVDEAVERALRDGYEIAENEAELAAARAEHRAAKALYGPRLMVDAKAFYFNERPTFDLDIFASSDGQDVPLWLDQALGTLLPDGPMEAGEQYSVDFRVTVVQPLTKLEAIAELSKVRALDVKIAEVHGTLSKVDLAHRVRETAYTLLKLRAGLVALEETEREIEARQKQIQAFRDAELVGPEEVLEVGVKLAEVRQGSIRARAFEHVAERHLALLLRLDGAAAIRVREPEGLPPLPALADCVARAVSARPELAEVQLRGDQAEAGVRAKVQEWVPEVSLVGSYQYQAGTSIGQPEIAVGAVMSWTPFAWGETLHGVRAAKAKARQARLARERVEALIGLDVERAFAEAHAQLESIDVARAQVAQAEELYRLERARLEVQHKTATDLLAAQTALLRARNDLSSARYDYLTALSALRRATGEP
jgi:outer membrane protein TolC